MTRRSVRFFFFIILAGLISVFAPSACAQDGLAAQTTADLNLRTGPGPEYVVIASLSAGTRVRVEGRDPTTGWVLVTTDGKRGWVSTCCIVFDAAIDLETLPLSPERGATYAEGASPDADDPPTQDAPPTPGGSTAAVTTALRMREGPSEEDAIVMILKAGATVAILERSLDGYWAHVRTAGGVEGWVSTCCLAPAGATTPPAAPPPGAGWNARTAAELNVRQGPSLAYEKLALLPPQTPVVLEARNATNGWALVHTGAGVRGWVAAAYLRFDAGVQIGDLPVADEIVAAAPASAPADSGAPGWQNRPIITVSGRAREIFLHGQTLGNNPGAISTIGDCNSDIGVYLGFFAWGQYTLGPDYQYLQPVIDHFGGSFARRSVTTWSGNHAWMVFDSTYAKPDLCKPGEAPIECEYRVNRPAVFLIEVGVNEAGTRTFADDLRAIIDFAVEKGVIPILATKADAPGGAAQGNNAIIRQIAAEYGVPLWDFGAVAETLPNNGLRADGVHLLWAPLDYTTPDALNAGHAVHNLTALMALDAVWRGAMQ
ncbi:MAG: SH3 domain-containing protein [Anaerolineae bacterium]|nr:SH3 domain-containing protein [Anaerolineae bacterium]